MERFKLSDLKDIHVGDLPAAKLGIVDSMLGKDINKQKVEEKFMSSYKKGHEIGSEIINLLKGDQRDY